MEDGNFLYSLEKEQVVLSQVNKVHIGEMVSKKMQVGLKLE